MSNCPRCEGAGFLDCTAVAYCTDDSHAEHCYECDGTGEVDIAKDEETT